MATMMAAIPTRRSSQYCCDSRSMTMLLRSLAVCLLMLGARAFVPGRPMTASIVTPRSNILVYASEDPSDDAKASLEEKMKAWEASEEEVKAATLGGVVPDAFDVGLWLLFPLMVGSALLFAIFPLIMGNLDVGDVGPPPTV